ncbi:trehalase-like [Sitophilus oryzae]|uniref:Trehalase n=1 Tax=Sitophilus oryzae TaxID=7048 RepID=A0A6J2XHS3_SITOR|nr:trehalase-like [Sitophilus oryzae]XP_030750480.1 trehalase-like [Sitophilus oryzae]
MSTKLFLIAILHLAAVYGKPFTTTNQLSENPIVPTCSSPIYCQGELLNVVQMSGIFNDSKTFVDMSQVNTVNVTLDNFSKLMAKTNNDPSRQEVEQFVNENFISQAETVEWAPPDFNPSPSFLQNINDESVRVFAKNVVGIWPTLGRNVSSDVEQNPEKHSIIPIPNGFIIPGGRFRESYYWDSFWIIRGLLISDMPLTVKSMLSNFCYLIENFGFIPNGARVYYLNRSQPPLFSLMVALYIDHTNDTDWLVENVQYVEKELNFWLDNKTVEVEKDGEKYTLAHYNSKSNTPRSESFSEDVKTCNFYTNEDDKQLCYQSLKTGAETGWDFSSRWFFDDNGGTKSNLSHIRPQRLIPVDLNSYLCKGFREMSNFYGILGNSEKQNEWLEKADAWTEKIQLILYNTEDGIWYDYDTELQSPRKDFYPSNFAPLWADAYDTSLKEEYGKRAAEYFVKEGIDQFPGGIPTSLDQSGEQWDFSNAWPPLQELVVLGLKNSGNDEAVELAKAMGTRWVAANMKGYSESQIMYEKYDAVAAGEFGGGGEYVVQAGFGWTNGVALHFIKLFYSSDE